MQDDRDALNPLLSVDTGTAQQSLGLAYSSGLA